MRVLAGVALAALGIAAGGCGGGSSQGTSATEASAPLTKAQYSEMLKQGNAQVASAEAAAENGLMSNATSAEMKALLVAWADTETRLGNSFRAVRPPADAVTANALLAQGEIAFGAELRNAASHLPKRTAQIGAYLEGALGHAKGAATIDQAIAKLKDAGYGSG